ncbi:MAG: threonine aldolase [Candidatus Cloacimonadota bacterium]|nr:MAG: threonine aldolase [Candidatus Cloacimonadota bacterium]PIE81402.1 MAG: threonine aldolase [Candidatus Delongbacteria bacterium]
MITDLRSDTFTLPTDEMKKAIVNAKLGDDVFREDKSVIELENLISEMTGKESALLVSSGTMGNLIALMVHCNRGSEVVLGDQSHIYYYEQGGISSIASLIPKPLKNYEDGTIDIDDIENSLRDENIHFPETKLICLESTHNRCNGSPLELSYMERVYKLAKSKGLNIHLDGARIFNAISYLNVDLNQVFKFVDSGMICLSKGLGSPIGSLLVGSKEFITKARRVRKVLGGGMRQAGVIAAPGIVSLKKISKIIVDDNRRALEIAKFVDSINGFSVDLDLVKTNIFYIDTEERLAEDVVKTLSENGIFSFSVGKHKIRFVTHYMIKDDNIDHIKNVFFTVFG